MDFLVQIEFAHLVNGFFARNEVIEDEGGNMVFANQINNPDTAECVDDLVGNEKGDGILHEINEAYFISYSCVSPDRNNKSEDILKIISSENVIVLAKYMLLKKNISK